MWNGILPSRQVHLDFHTSEHIPGVGSRFDRKQFQEALKLGHLNSMTVFAKCHHSWNYYPTTIGKMHPALEFDLMGQQIEACHEIGVRAPIYLTVGWSSNDAENHPEWCVHKQDGSIFAFNWDVDAGPQDRRPITSWKNLCPSGGYLELMLAQTREICQQYPVDGFFYDITNGPICYCDTCRQGMEQQGIDCEDLEAVIAYNVRKWKHFMAECRRVIFTSHPEATIFFNGTTMLYTDPVIRDCTSRMFDGNTHQELEDLPTTWGGYDKFPLRSKLFHHTGKQLLAMSGKFHTMWGEFGGFKHPNAIKYEAASMIAFGAGCSFGDQLHPAGEMDLETYRNIGVGYAYVKEIEAYGPGGQPASNLGLWPTGNQEDDEGVVRMLLETQTDFDVVDPDSELSGYETIILSGAACLTEEHAQQINAFINNGGGVLVLGESALNSRKDRFIVDVGASYLGPANYDEDFLVVGEQLRENLVTSPFFNYQAAIRVKPDAGTDILAQLHEPYFDRTYATYCSHQNTPNRLEFADHPGALRKGNVVFLPHRLGSLYFRHGARVHRDLFINALRLIYRTPMLTTALPSCGRINFLHQPKEQRYVAHLLYAPALQRGRCSVIEDLVPLYHVPLEVRVPEAITQAYLIPGKQSLPITKQANGTLKVIIPEFQCHCGVVLEYSTIQSD